MTGTPCGRIGRAGRHGARSGGVSRDVRGAVRAALLSLSVLAAAFAPIPAGAADLDAAARTLMSGIGGGARVALLPIDRRVGLPEEAHQRFHDALANALGRAARRGITMVSGPRQRAIYRHLVETYEEDLDAELQSILRSAKADFVVICLWKTDDPEGFELSCAPSAVGTIERLDGVGVRFEWDRETEYLEFVVARLARKVLGNRDVGGVQDVRMRDRRFGGATDLTEFVTDLLQHEAMEVAGERGFPGAGEGTGPVYRIEGEVWHPDDEQIRLRVRLHRGGGSDGGGRLVAGDDVYLAVSTLPSNLRPLAMTLVDETWRATRRTAVRSRPGAHETTATLAPGDTAYVTARVTGLRGQEWLRVELDDGQAGFVLASSLSGAQPAPAGGMNPGGARVEVEAPATAESGEGGEARPVSPGTEAPAAFAGGLRVSDWLMLAEDRLAEGDHRTLLVEGAGHSRAHGANAAVEAVVERALAGLLAGVRLDHEAGAREALATAEQIRGVVGERPEPARVEAEAHVRLGQLEAAVAAYRRWLDLAPADHPKRREMLRAMRRAERGESGPEGDAPAEVGKPFRACETTWCPELVVVPSGSFMMGSPSREAGRYADEGPVHEVTIARPFAVGVYEVTFEEWDACRRGGGCTHNPDDRGWGRGSRPVINVSWEDAQAYVRWLSRETGKRYRLLSESEWEYVARAGTTGPFHFGSTISTEQANYDGNYTHGSGRKGEYRRKTVPVGEFPPNAFGLHDVHGNVWEWVEDCWHASYDGAPSDGSAWTSGGDCSRRVLRGGSWDDVPQNLRSANRVRNTTGVRSDYIGFRVARTLN